MDGLLSGRRAERRDAVAAPASHRALSGKALGCLEIEFGHGVCGTAAAERRTIIVPDVAAFPGPHRVRDPLARSEIVVPVYGPDGALIAVFHDLDNAAYQARLGRSTLRGTGEDGGVVRSGAKAPG